MIRTTINSVNSRQVFRRTFYRTQTRAAEGRITRFTGPVEPIRGRRALILGDIENLDHSAADLGFAIRYDRLGSLLRQSTSARLLHAFFSEKTPNGSRARGLSDLGWNIHSRRVSTAQTRFGLRRFANADNLMLFLSGVIVSRSAADTVVVASGDGDLVCGIVEGMKSLPAPRRIVTLSLAGSTSQRLDAKKNPDVYANIEIGLDCLRPLQR